ncbi:MAG TPA: methyltransferase domain-containing protein [Gemmatimonadales bacterium]|nr:methyltransferase domain-containing protein [Gemmatimonadales bacterium]
MSALTTSPVGTELLDDPAADPAVVAISLRNISRSNRWFGGAAAVRHGLARVLADVPRGASLTLLDLGTGAGDLPRVAAGWAGRRGIRLRPVGLELSRVAARLARAAGVPCLVGCAGMPPLREKSVDLVLASQLLHHLAPDSVVRLLRTCDRLARVGVVVADLRRGRLAPLAFHIGARALGFDRHTLADGLTSIRRGYTPAELSELLRAAGIAGRVSRRPMYRLVATWRPRA